MKKDVFMAAVDNISDRHIMAFADTEAIREKYRKKREKRSRTLRNTAKKLLLAAVISAIMASVGTAVVGKRLVILISSKTSVTECLNWLLVKRRSMKG